MSSEEKSSVTLPSALSRSDVGTLVGREFALAAPAKLNLRIKIEGRRDDGFHLLSMFNVLTSLSDALRIVFRSETGVAIQGVEGELAQPEHNLASRAVELFLRSFEIPLGATINLDKRIPVGAGFGGGSSDAGVILRFLGELFRGVVDERGPANSDKLLAQLAVDLGSDVPFFYHGRFARVTGIGERVERYDARFITQQRALLVVPTSSISTTEFYRVVREKLPEVRASRDLKGEQFGETLRLNTAVEGYEPFPSRTIRASLWRHLLSVVENDFEPFILTMAPELKPLVESLRAVPDSVVSFTGSGSALFVLGKGLDGFSKVKEQVTAVLQESGCRVEDVALLDRAPLTQPVASEQ